MKPRQTNGLETSNFSRKFEKIPYYIYALNLAVKPSKTSE